MTNQEQVIALLVELEIRIELGKTQQESTLMFAEAKGVLKLAERVGLATEEQRNEMVQRLESVWEKRMRIAQRGR